MVQRAELCLGFKRSVGQRTYPVLLHIAAYHTQHEADVGLSVQSQPMQLTSLIVNYFSFANSERGSRLTQEG